MHFYRDRLICLSKYSFVLQWLICEFQFYIIKNLRRCVDIRSSAFFPTYTSFAFRRSLQLDASFTVVHQFAATLAHFHHFQICMEVGISFVHFILLLISIDLIHSKNSHRLGQGSFNFFYFCCGISSRTAFIQQRCLSKHVHNHCI